MFAIWKWLKEKNLNANVVTTPVRPKAHSNGLVNKLSGSITRDSSHGPSPFFYPPILDLLIVVNYFKKLTGPKRQHQQILHSLNRRKLLFVMEHVRDRRRSRIAHRESTSNRNAPRFSINGTGANRIERTRLCPRGAADIPETEIETIALERVGA